MTIPNNFPDMHEGQVAIACAEVETGIILSTAGVRAIGTTERYRVFSSIEEASECARSLVASNRLWECYVLDHMAIVVETFRDEAAVLALRRTKAPVGWWRRWIGK